MISIFILFSNDRVDNLSQFLFHLQQMEKYKNCQKILCVDGSTELYLDEFDIIEIPRTNNLYCWAEPWNRAIEIARFEKILYLDCDRILQKDFLEILSEKIKDNTFYFPRKIHEFIKPCSSDTLMKVLKEPNDFKHLYKTTTRELIPENSIRVKNPISGCTGFTKKTFIKSGGLDKSFVGWGYPDADFFMKTSKLGMQFQPVDVKEFHLNHEYAIPTKTFRLQNLFNGVKFCKKWNLNIHIKLIDLAKELNTSIDDVESSNSIIDFVKTQSKKQTLL